ncbi:cysteine--tRNA ligase [Candidatus Woesearchaeota archaeon]|nr:cysteine--tRNA ligase [Candidatus Woesearchaeota archaeon]
MALKVYNTLTRKKELFKPRKGKKVNLFVCGITPQDFAHIGHAKTYIQFDLVVKYLRYSGFKVFYLQNVTDLDDKIIDKSKKEKTDCKTIARKYEKEYHNDMGALNVNCVDKFARATDYIREIIKQVETLMDKGFAYGIEDDGIYFNLNKFPEYGKLSGRTTEEAEDSISRIDESKEKINRGDFCLWKVSKKGEPKWKDPWFHGGRPGWHIEDTAITESFFGPQYDIHGGSRDLIFPHHEAEIAQMESASGKKPLVRYWVHTGFLNVEGKKMSKSLGNVIIIKDLLKEYDSKLIRYFFVANHYRTPIDFSKKLLEPYKNSLQRLNDFIIRLKNSREKDNIKLIEKTKNIFIEAMDDDFDTPKAFSIIFDFVREVNKSGGGKKTLEFLKDIDSIFNILTFEEDKLEKEITKLIEKREKARKEKNYKEADKIREELNEKGIILEDTKNGVRWKKL